MYVGMRRAGATSSPGPCCIGNVPGLRRNGDCACGLGVKGSEIAVRGIAMTR